MSISARSLVAPDGDWNESFGASLRIPPAILNLDALNLTLEYERVGGEISTSRGNLFSGLVTAA